jgi:hypothetical protein
MSNELASKYFSVMILLLKDTSAGTLIESVEPLTVTSLGFVKNGYLDSTCSPEPVHLCRFAKSNSQQDIIMTCVIFFKQ